MGLILEKEKRNSNKKITNSRNKTFFFAHKFRILAKKGKDGFYSGLLICSQPLNFFEDNPSGEIGEKIVKILQQNGSSMTIEDLKNHKTIFVDPISINYKGINIYEIPPNGQGIATLISLNILKNIDQNEEQKQKESNFVTNDWKKRDLTSNWHILIEAMRLGFADARWSVGKDFRK